MHRLWQRIERWFDANTDGGLALRDGVAEAKLAELEDAMGRRLPEDLRESFLVHDGQDMPPVRWLDGERRFHALGSIFAQWQFDASETGNSDVLTSDERARVVLVHHGRLPLVGTSCWDGDSLYADFIPGRAGHKGQLVYRAGNQLRVVADSWREFLEEYARKLEGGALVFHPGVPNYPEARGCIVVPGSVAVGHDVFATFGDE